MPPHADLDSLGCLVDMDLLDGLTRRVLNTATDRVVEDDNFLDARNPLVEQ